MRKNTLLTWLVAGTLCVSACGAFTATNTFTASGEEKSALLVTELFAPSQIKLDPMKQDANMAVLDKGLLLTSENAKNTLEWQDEAMGQFSLSYLPTQTGAMYDAKSLEITFTDAADQDSFTIVIEHGETMNAYVRFNGVSAGKYYYVKNEFGFTEFCNEDGLYTQFSAKKIGVRFDPSTMCVYVGNTEDTLYLVWDMSQEINDRRDVGKTLAPFEKYNVSFKMPAFSLQKGAILLYEVNGCPLNDLFVSESGEISVFADFEKNALVGQEYALPQGYAYDVLDGALETTVAVYDTSGSLIGNELEKFTPTAAGEYTVAYTATNSFGKTTTGQYVLTAYATAPDYAAEIDWALNDEYVLNEQVYVPELWLSSGIRRYGKELGTVTIEKDGSVYTGFENKTSGFAFTFTDAGEYAFVYNINGEEARYNVLVNGAENRFVTAGLQSKYAKNSIVDCQGSYVLIGGEKADFDFTVKFPSGKRYVNKKFQANEVGRYALNAVATVGEKTYSFEKFFTVAEDNTDYFLAMHGAEIENGKSIYTGREGVKVTTTTSGALVEYTEPVNISKYVNQSEWRYEGDEFKGIKITENAIPLIELTVDPDSMNVRSALEVFIYITDAADPTNKITINARNRADYAAVSAGATGQTLRGYTNLAPTNTDAKMVIDGQYGNLQEMGSTCFRLLHTFDGQANKDSSTSVISLYYDNEQKQLLGVPAIGGGVDNNVILDFDDTRYLQSDLPWGGFKSDYVYISVAVNDLQTSQATSCIYTIDGRSFGLVEETAPTISVDSEDTLVGLKGYSLAVPSATARDCYSNAAKVIAKVYYEKDGKRFDVSVQNGRFNTAQSGDYYIVYTATDVFGRTSEKEIKVEAMETHAELVAALDDPTVEYTSGKIADKIAIFGVENVEISDAIGKVESVCKLYFGAEEIALVGESFVPEKAGAYKVEYTFTDTVGRTASVFYNVEIAVPEEPVVTSALPVYKGFVRGNTYQIADVYFIDYEKSDISEQKADVYIDGEKFTGLEYKLADKIEEKDASEEIESLRLEYRYGETVLKGYDIPVKTVKKYADKKLGAQTIKVTRLLTERYFVTSENTSITAQKTYFQMTSKKSGEEVWFAQALQANGFTIFMDIDQEKTDDLTPVATNLKAIKLRIVDANDSEKSVLVEIQTDSISKKARLCVNGEDYSAAFAGSIVGAAVELIRLRYNDGYFYDANSASLRLVAPSHYENGETFEGFSDAVYVSLAIEAEDEEKDASIRLYSINDQQLSSDTEADNAKPVLTVENEHGGIYEQGAEIELSAAKAYDVLSSIDSESLTVSVTYERDGETKYAVIDGLKMENVAANKAYQLTLTETGSYKIVYSVLDSYDNDRAVTFTFEVVKYQDPVIEVNGELPESVKAGRVVNVPLASASFVQENEKNMTWIVVIAPSTNTYMLISEDDPAFVATELGDYKIRYCAIDAYGSYTIVEYIVRCYA